MERPTQHCSCAAMGRAVPEALSVARFVTRKVVSVFFVFIHHFMLLYEQSGLHQVTTRGLHEIVEEFRPLGQCYIMLQILFVFVHCACRGGTEAGH